MPEKQGLVPRGKPEKETGLFQPYRQAEKTYTHALVDKPLFGWKNPVFAPNFGV